MRRVVLIGLRRSGKTTVGRLVATKAQWAFVDTDELIASTTGRPPADWIRADGIEAFRVVEQSAVASLRALRDAVVATGGGVPLAEANREALREDALVVYLRADPWVLARRAAADPGAAERPPIGAATVAEEPFVHFADRDALYRDYADMLLDAGRPATDLAEAIMGRVDRARRTVSE
jgi:shikimate kinase